MITTLTGKNQITVPASIVAEANLRPGMRLEWQLKEDGVLEARILPGRSTMASALRGAGRRLRKKVAGSAVDRLVEERTRDERARKAHD